MSVCLYAGIVIIQPSTPLKKQKNKTHTICLIIPKYLGTHVHFIYFKYMLQHIILESYFVYYKCKKVNKKDDKWKLSCLFYISIGYLVPHLLLGSLKTPCNSTLQGACSLGRMRCLVGGPVCLESGMALSRS